MECSSLDALPEALGFVEPPELASLRRQVIEVMAAGGDCVPLLAQYQSEAEVVASRSGGASAQIGLIVQTALMRRDGGLRSGYRADLVDALTYASNMGMAAAEAVLERALRETKS